MNRALHTSLAIALLLPLGACKTIEEAIPRLARLDAVCVTGYSTSYTPRAGGAYTATMNFSANLTNPQSQDAQGSLGVYMVVTVRNISLGTPPQNTAIPSQPYATPVTTIYPAQVSNGFVTPVLVGAPHDPGVVYDIEIRTNIPGIEWDGSPCHTYKRVNFRVPAPQ